MVFGKFQGNKRLDAQKMGLRETLDRLAEVERRIADPAALREHFAEVWEGVPGDIRDRLTQARELAAVLSERIALARYELPDFDDAAGFLKRAVDALVEQWNAFSGLLMARQTIAQGASRSVPATRAPSTADCQRALIEIAGDFRDAVRTHLDELTEVKAAHTRPWPERLDLPALARELEDVDAALDIYRRRLHDEGELAQSATVTLTKMISILQARVAMIEAQRVDLAADLAISTVLRNVGLGA